MASYFPAMETRLHITNTERGDDIPLYIGGANGGNGYGFVAGSARPKAQKKVDYPLNAGQAARPILILSNSTMGIGFPSIRIRLTWCNYTS